MAHRLIHTGGRFKSKFSRVDGFNFYGQILDIPDTSRVSNFLSARRYLRTRPDTAIKPSDVVIIDGIKYLVGEHGTGFFVTPIYKHFKLFEITNVATWSTVVRTENAITGIFETTRPTPEEIFLSVQPRTDIDDSTHIPLQAYIALTNKPVKRNDIVDGKQVIKVDSVLGCWLIEMKEV